MYFSNKFQEYIEPQNDKNLLPKGALPGIEPGAARLFVLCNENESGLC